MADLIHDTFTDADNTLLGNHAGETNASWTAIPDWPYLFGNYTPGTMRVLSNKLTIDPMAGLPSISSEEAFLCSGQIQSENFELEIGFVFSAGFTTMAFEAFVGASAAGDGSGNPFVRIASGVVEVAGGAANGGISHSATWTTGVEYVARLVATGSSVELFVNDVSVGSYTSASALTPYLSIYMIGDSMMDPANALGITYLRVLGEAGVTLFWTNFRGQREVA